MLYSRAKHPRNHEDPKNTERVELSFLLPKYRFAKFSFEENKKG